MWGKGRVLESGDSFLNGTGHIAQATRGLVSPTACKLLQVGR
jgi:hypothetical protein